MPSLASFMRNVNMPQLDRCVRMDSQSPMYLLPLRTSQLEHGDHEDLAATTQFAQSPESRLMKSIIPSRKGVMSLFMRWLAVIFVLYFLHSTGLGSYVFRVTHIYVKETYDKVLNYDWKASASFQVTDAMRMSIVMSLALGIVLGFGVGLMSGLEPAIVIGVSASMALGCLFVMSFAVLHGVNALRAVSFAMFVSICLPFGFGYGFGTGILVGMFVGLEDPDDIRDKINDFITNFGDFVKVVTAFTLEIR